MKVCVALRVVDGCPAPPVERGDNISVECSCKGTLDSSRYLLLDCFWNIVGAILASGGCCILFVVAKLMVCTGLARRSKTGQAVSKTRHALVILRSPHVALCCGGLAAAAALLGGSAKFWLSATHGANVMNCVAVLKCSFIVGTAMDLSVFHICPVDSCADIDIGCLMGICILAGAAAAAAFVWKFPFFSIGSNPVKLHGLVTIATGSGCSAGRNSPSSLEGTAPRDKGTFC